MSIPIIAITNESTVLTDAQVKAVIPALQEQVTHNFKQYWNVDCTLVFLPKGQPLLAGRWQIVIFDNSDQAGALGYHDLSAVGTPLGSIFAKTDMDNGQSWTITTSHELLEMLVDPWITLCAQGTDNKIYALEVGDAVEADEFGYSIFGVMVSDFITPSWFAPTEFTRFDFKQHLSSPLTLTKGGYMSIYNPRTGWTEINAQHPAPIGSRRYRRARARQ